MKVRQLLQKLKDVDQNAEVVLSSDAEGNNFSLLQDVGDPALFDKGSESWFDIDNEDKEDPTPKSARLAICLWP